MTAYDIRISDWSSDVCSSDLPSCPCSRRWRDPSLAHQALRPEKYAAVSSVKHETLCRCPPAETRDLYLDQERSLVRNSVVWGKSVSIGLDCGGRSIIKITI